VIEERLQVVPPADIEHQDGIDTGGGQVRRPRSPEIVKAQLCPCVVIGLGHQLGGGIGDPPPEGAGAHLDRVAL
jgi:hypothetical protein